MSTGPLVIKFGGTSLGYAIAWNHIQRRAIETGGKRGWRSRGWWG